jgi:thiamine pyrophosphokinase
LKESHSLIIANGTPPPLTVIRPLVDTAQLIVCADGGANHALRMNVKPHVIIGDFDSIAASTRHYFSHVQQLHDPRQDSTDLEKAIAYCIQQGSTSIDLLAAGGDRVDHVTGALGCFKKFGDRVDLRIIDTVGIISQIKNSVSFTARAREKISLIPLDRCTGITTLGLLYALDNETLELGVREGISNEATSTGVTIAVATGTLLLYRFHPK